MTEQINITAGKKYRTKHGEIVTAVVDGVDKHGLAVVNCAGEWCFHNWADLTEVVELPEWWINEYGRSLGSCYATREEADNIGHHRLGVWHLKPDGTGEFIPTP